MKNAFLTCLILMAVIISSCKKDKSKEQNNSPSIVGKYRVDSTVVEMVNGRMMMYYFGQTMDFRANGELHAKQHAFDSVRISSYTFQQNKLYMNIDTVPGEEEYQVQFLKHRTILTNQDSTSTTSLYLTNN